LQDATKAPKSEFSRTEADVATQLEQALLELNEQPAATSILNDLEQRMARAGHQAALADAYAELFGSDAAEALPARARVDVYLRTARLCAQQNAHAAIARLAATRALDLSPADERGLAIAQPLLLAAQDYDELVSRTAAAAALLSDERARQLLQRVSAELEPIPAAEPARLRLSEELARLQASGQQADDLLLTSVRSGGPEAARALVKLGERWLAAGRVRENIAQLPADLDALQSEAALDVLERLFEHADEPARLEQVLLRRVNVEQSPLGRARALEKLAGFQHEANTDPSRPAGAFFAAATAYESAGEVDDAERAYEQVLTVLPDHADAARRLVALRARAGNFAAVTGPFAVVLRVETDNQQLAQLLLSLVADAERAGAAEEFADLADDVLWRLSADERELSERLLRASARLYATQTKHDEAAELYRRLIADHATSEDLDAYQALIEAHPDSDWRSHQQRWLFEWQEHHSADRPTVLLAWAHFEERDLGDPEAAMKVLERAAELAPDRAEVWENLARLRLAAGDGSGGVAASHELRRLGREPDASLLTLLLEHEPAARWAIDRVKLTLSAESRWEELFELYDRAIWATADDGERAGWMNEAAIAARDVAQDPKRATQYWEQYSILTPTDTRVDMALERLYEQANDKPALLRHLERRLERSHGAERAALEARVVTLALDIGALDDALTAIDRLRVEAPEAGDALLEQLFARSQQLSAQPGARAAGRSAARSLRERYVECGKPQAAARVLQAELGLELAPEERCELLDELSHLSELQLGDLVGAFAAQRELFLATRDEAQRKRLEKLGKTLGNWRELCEAHAQAAAAEPELEAKRALLARAAELASVGLHDDARATQFYLQLFQLEPEHAVVDFEKLEAQRGETPEAFDALCRLLEAAGRFAELSQLLQRTISSRPSPALFSRLGRLQAEQLGDPAAAIESHLAASDARTAGQVFLRQPSVFGDNPTPALELARRLSSAGLPEGSLLVLRHQLAFYAERHPSERKPVLLELVKTLEESGAHAAALEELAEAARRFPTDAAVQRACAAAAVAARDWDRAEQYYRSLLLLLHGSGAETTALRRASVYVELAAIKAERGDAAASAELVDSGFEAALGSETELTALAESLIGHELWAPAERAISELLQLARDARSAAGALAGVARLRQRGQALPPELVARAEQIARDYAARHGELSDALERSRLLGACVALVPLEQAEQLLLETREQLTPEHLVKARLELSRRWLETGSEAARTKAISELKALLGHPAAEAEAWPLLAQAWEASGEVDELKSALAARLERAPSDPTALAYALRLSLAGGDTERALELHERLVRAGAARDPELSARLGRLCVEAGELLLSQGEVKKARAACERARMVDPLCAQAVVLSAKLLLLEGRRDAALSELSQYAESKDRRRDKGLSGLLRLTAQLRLDRDELSEALPLLSEAHQLDKADLDTALLLGLLAIDLDRLDTASSALRVVVAQRELGTRDRPRSPSVAQGYLQLARIEQHHGKKINAKRMALRALEENPNLVPAQRLLSELGLH
jgi:tetratricopeptide (TPR) repeat protein